MNNGRRVDIASRTLAIGLANRTLLSDFLPGPGPFGRRDLQAIKTLARSGGP